MVVMQITITNCKNAVVYTMFNNGTLRPPNALRRSARITNNDLTPRYRVIFVGALFSFFLILVFLILLWWWLNWFYARLDCFLHVKGSF